MLQARRGACLPGVGPLIHVELSDAVRHAVACAGENEDIRQVVARARGALVDAEAVSLMALETRHAGLGALHWIVSQSGAPEDGFLVIAIASDAHGEHGRPLFTASAANLSDAFRELIAQCGEPVGDEASALSA